MTSYYFMNLAGIRPSEEKLEQVNHPRFELFTHVTTKTVQSGTILGAGMVGPLMSVAKGGRDFSSIQESAYTFGKKGALLGLILGPTFFFMRASSMDREGVWDRAYRLRFNRNQNFVDRLSFLGAAAGAGAAHYVGEELGKGALFGFAGGCLLAGIFNNVF